MIVMVTGGRNFDDRAEVVRRLKPYRKSGNILLSGGATGADKLCEIVWGGSWELPYVVMPAAWKRAGRAAGPMRSRTLIVGNALAPHAVLKPDVLVVFAGDRGTAQAIRFAKENGVDIDR